MNDSISPQQVKTNYLNRSNKIDKELTQSMQEINSLLSNIHNPTLVKSLNEYLAIVKQGVALQHEFIDQIVQQHDALYSEIQKAYNLTEKSTPDAQAIKTVLNDMKNRLSTEATGYKATSEEFQRRYQECIDRENNVISRIVPPIATAVAGAYLTHAHSSRNSRRRRSSTRSYSY